MVDPNAAAALLGNALGQNATQGLIAGVNAAAAAAAPATSVNWWLTPVGAACLILCNSLLAKTMIFYHNTGSDFYAKVHDAKVWAEKQKAAMIDAEWSVFLVVCLIFLSGYSRNGGGVVGEDKTGWEADQALCMMCYLCQIGYFWTRVTFSESAFGEGEKKVKWYNTWNYVRYIAALWIVCRITYVSADQISDNNDALAAIGLEILYSFPRNFAAIKGRNNGLSFIANMRISQRKK